MKIIAYRNWNSSQNELITVMLKKAHKTHRLVEITVECECTVHLYQFNGFAPFHTTTTSLAANVFCED